jgi:undecaprenyl-diphosphatase
MVNVLCFMTLMDNFEIKFVKYLNQTGFKWLDSFLGLVNSIRFLAFFWLALTIVAVITHPVITNSFLIAVLIVCALHFGITEGIIKHFLTRFLPKRKRPYVSYPEIIIPIGKKFSDASFPSSHMATTVAMLVVIVSFYPSLLLLSIGMIVLMAFSRLHNGMHYPSDVVVGMLLGYSYGWVALEVVRRMF